MITERKEFYFAPVKFLNSDIEKECIILEISGEAYDNKDYFYAQIEIPLEELAKKLKKYL